MRVLITGSGGQLGAELVASAPPDTEVRAFDRVGLDVTDEKQLTEVFRQLEPTVVLNTAAFTAVDRCETERDACWEVNVEAVATLARLCGNAPARFVHISTDYVFDGATAEPYAPDAEANPLSEYGVSKLASEEAALSVPGGTVIRTSRVYSSRGENFVTKMLDAMRREPDLRVVDDQVGSPTWARGLAGVVWRVAEQGDLSGIWHWSDAGACTWYDWAVAIRDEALQRGLIERQIPIHPVPTTEYPTRARRPPFSVLDCSATVETLGVRQVPWREALGTMLDAMPTPAST